MGNPETFLVRYGGIDGLHSSMIQNGNDIQAQLDALEVVMREIDEAWSGAAREAYRGAQTQWDQSAADIKGILASITTAVGNINEVTRAADNAAANVF